MGGINGFILGSDQYNRELINLMNDEIIHRGPDDSGIFIDKESGISGWAQRDELSIVDKVKLDIEYMNRKSSWFDVGILCKTFFYVVKKNGVYY